MLFVIDRPTTAGGQVLFIDGILVTANGSKVLECL